MWYAVKCLRHLCRYAARATCRMMIWDICVIRALILCKMNYIDKKHLKRGKNMTMEEARLELYWNEIPIGKANALSYAELCAEWGVTSRRVRSIMHELSAHDNGDNYILVRSARGGGFYRTDDVAEIAAYRAECLNRGKRTLVPLKKIDRVLKPDVAQLSIENNLKAVRLARGLKASNVCDAMRRFDNYFDVALLSRMENGRCCPTPLQLAHLAGIYGCTPQDLMNMEMYRNIV